MKKRWLSLFLCLALTVSSFSTVGAAEADSADDAQEEAVIAEAEDETEAADAEAEDEKEGTEAEDEAEAADAVAEDEAEDEAEAADTAENTEALAAEEETAAAEDSQDETEEDETAAATEAGAEDEGPSDKAEDAAEEAESSQNTAAAVSTLAGDDYSSATQMSVGTTISGSITDDNTKDFYYFTLSTSGKFSFALTAYFYRMKIYVYDSEGNTIWYDNYVYWNSTTEQISYEEDIYLTSGTYYLAFSQGSGTGAYSFSTAFTSSGESFKETTGGVNNELKSASSISVNTTYKGQIAANDSKDFYSFTIGKSGKVTWTLTAYIYRLKLYLYDSDGDTVWYDNYVYWNSTTEQISYSTTFYLNSGTYYLAISGGSGNGTYSFNTAYTSAGESFSETGDGSNNDITSANSISLGKTYKGMVGNNDSKDFYKFKLSKKRTISIVSTAYVSKMKYYIYDSSGSEVWSTTQYENSTTGKISMAETEKLSAGTYYLAVVQSSGNGTYKLSVSYAFTDSTIKLSTTKYTYNGKKRTPSVTVKNTNGTKLTKGTHYTVSYSSSSRKKIGTYTVTIKGKGIYSGLTASTTFVIKPAKVSKIKSAKYTKSNSTLKVKWSKVSGGVSYQVAYKVKGKSWTYVTVSSTSLSRKMGYFSSYYNLSKGKTMYVKVRAYKTVDGTTIYGSWSSTKKFKTK